MLWFVTAFGIPESLIELSELSIGLPSSPIRIAFRFGKSLPDHSGLAVYNPNIPLVLISTEW